MPFVQSASSFHNEIMFSHVFTIPIAAVWLAIYSVASLTWMDSVSVCISSSGRHDAKPAAYTVQQSVKVTCGIHLWSHYIHSAVIMLT